MSIKVGRLKGEKKTFPDGVGCCVWFPLVGEDDDMGICFDFLPEDIDDFIVLLQRLRDMEPELCDALRGLEHIGEADDE